MKTNKALVLLNMGGARSKDELKTFLTNMFNDRNILTIKCGFFRGLVASMIVKSRLNSAWKNYEEIGSETPLHKLTEKLVDKLNKNLEGYRTYQVMRYTAPFASDVIKQMEEDGIDDITILPLYPQFSTTTTKSSLEDFELYSDDKFTTKIIKTFYKNEKFNNCIVNEIMSQTDTPQEYNLIFSAHGLPQKIVDAGDPYEKQMNEHVEILSNMLKKKGIDFNSISLAYQSKVGPLKWLEPSLDDALLDFKDKNVIIYPLAFIVDNSETDFELNLEYREIAEEIGVGDYKVCKCVNDSDLFIEAIKDIIK
jgi:protoporphyrin/coproporphyrin ferrochelatase